MLLKPLVLSQEDGLGPLDGMLSYARGLNDRSSPKSESTTTVVISRLVSK